MENISDIIKELKEAKFVSSVIPTLPTPIVMVNGLKKIINKLLLSLQGIGGVLKGCPKTYTEILDYHISGSSKSIESIRDSVNKCLSTTSDEKVRNSLMELRGESQELLSYLNKIISVSEVPLTEQDTLGTNISVASSFPQYHIETDRLNDLVQKTGELPKDISEKMRIQEESSSMHYFDAFFLPCIVAIAVIVVAGIYHGDICKENCDFCRCKFVLYSVLLLIITAFTIFCFLWGKYVERKYEKFVDLELKGKNASLEQQSDVFELQMSIYRHQLHQIELQEQIDKTRLDEYARDKEHLRKIELREQERIAGIADKIIELGKIRNTITTKKDNREEVIEVKSLFAK